MPEYTTKFSPATKQHLSALSTTDSSELSVIVRIAGSVSSERSSQIEAIDAEVRTIAGDVVTIVIPVKSLPKLAALDYVIYIELAGPLYPESGEQQ